MLIELLRYKNKLPFDLYKEVLLNYRKIMPQLNIQEIQDIAMQSPKQAMVMEVLKAREAATHGSLDGSEGGDDLPPAPEPAPDDVTAAESEVTV